MRKIMAILFLSTLPLSAAIFHEIDSTKALSCTFSNKQHNRILVEEGRVKKVICQDEKLLVRVEDISGQVFIQAKYPLQDPILISVVTQDGLVQDVEIHFANCSSQVVVLRNGYPEECFNEVTEVISCEISPVQESIDCILRGKVPVGYQSVPFRRSVIHPKIGVSSKLVGRLQGLVDTLLVYEVANSTCFRRKVFEKEIACRGALWAFLQKNCVSPRERILAVVAVQNE